MYMSQHEFTPVPERFEKWVPYNWNYMTVTGRAPGAVLSRIIRRDDTPEVLYAVGIWTSHQAAVDWTNSATAKLAMQPSIDLGLYDGYPMAWSRWQLADFAWGPRGPSALAGPGAFVRHVTWDIDPALGSAQETMSRAAMALLSRRQGFVSGEIYRGHKGDKLMLVYTFASEADWPFAGETMAPDLELLLLSDRACAIRDAAPPAVEVDCSLYECVWGPDRAALDRFVLAAEPA